MSSCGGYPLGAQYDSRAPWNQPSPVTCPDCDGEGRIYTAIDLRTGKETRVTRTAWLAIPDSEDTARALRQWYYRGDEEECETCCGEGSVYPEQDPDDGFDELAAEERYYERKYGRG